MLILVRHAMPAFSPEVPAEQWPLSDGGRAAARALTATLPAGALLVASAERKAIETLAPGGAVVSDPRFNEVHRTGEPWDGNFRALRRAYVGGTSHEGWEPHASVAARFEAGVRDFQARADGRPLVIATHGMAMTVWLVARVGLEDPAGFWEALAFPQAVPVSGSW